MRSLLFLFILFTIAVKVEAQQAPPAKANYPLAARFSPKKQEKLLFSTMVDAHWLKKGNRFWYSYETTEGKKWYIVDPLKAEKKLMFDNARLAAELTKIVKDASDAQHLLIDSIRFIKDEHTIQFELKSTEEIEKKDTTVKKDSTAKKAGPAVKEKKIYYFEYNLDSGVLTELTDFKKPKRKPGWASISPDSATIIFARNYNLYYMDKANYEKAVKNEDDSTIIEKKLTTDGVEDFSYGDSFNETNVEREKNKNKRKPAFIYWSPDSKHFTMVKTDQRKVKDLWVINSIAEPRPTLETYKYQMPGEKEAPEDHLLLFDMAAKTQKEINVSKFKDEDLGIWSAPTLASSRDNDWRSLLWLGTNDKFYLTRTSRDLKKIDVMMVALATGEAKALIEERQNVYVETRRLGLVNGGKELVQWSERDGWAHFYLYDENGRFKNQITSGAFHCEDIVGIDEQKRILYFSANGKEPNEDPYYLHLYKINFDGTGMKLLNAGEFEHGMSMDDSREFFVDNYSRVNSIPKSALYSADGKKIMDLETSDFSSLLAAGYKFPQIFKVKADDGITDLYGVMYKPLILIVPGNTR